MTTAAPSSAKRLAVAAPIPVPPPVIIAILLVRRSDIHRPYRRTKHRLNPCSIVVTGLVDANIGVTCGAPRGQSRYGATRRGGVAWLSPGNPEATGDDGLGRTRIGGVERSPVSRCPCSIPGSSPAVVRHRGSTPGRPSTMPAQDWPRSAVDAARRRRSCSTPSAHRCVMMTPARIRPCLEHSAAVRHWSDRRAAVPLRSRRRDAPRARCTARADRCGATSSRRDR